MARLGLGGLLVSAAGGYLVGRHRDALRDLFERAVHRAGGPAPELRRHDYGTRYDELAQDEEERRHRLAEDIRRRPLRERAPQARDPETRPVAPPEAPKRDRDDIVTPRSI